jgi:hypothetical protein
MERQVLKDHPEVGDIAREITDASTCHTDLGEIAREISDISTCHTPQGSEQQLSSTSSPPKSPRSWSSDETSDADLYRSRSSSTVESLSQRTAGSEVEQDVESYRPKVGNCVQVHTGRYRGKFGRLMKDDGSGKPFRVEFDDGGGRWYEPQHVDVVPKSIAVSRASKSEYRALLPSMRKESMPSQPVSKLLRRRRAQQLQCHDRVTPVLAIDLKTLPLPQMFPKRKRSHSKSSWIPAWVWHNQYFKPMALCFSGCLHAMSSSRQSCQGLDKRTHGKVALHLAHLNHC